jgi:hypothetical protein
VTLKVHRRGADQTRMWPEIVRLLEEAQGRDWSRPMLLVPPTGEPEKLTVRAFGSFETVYAELVEPWLGSWAELRRTYARFKAGEITEEQGREEITLRANGGDWKSKEFQSRDHETDPVSKSDTASYIKARLRRDDPDPAARVERGELTANAAAVAKGWRRKPTRLDELRRAWRRTSAEDRRAFLAEISAHEEKPEA